MKKVAKENFFYWALCLVIMTLPFPKYSLNSQSIILLFISWLFFNNYSDKLNNLKKMKLPFFIMSSMFWISLLSLFYSSDIEIVIDIIIQNLPFLILPLIIFTTIRDGRTLIQIIKIFSFSVIIASLFGIAKAFYFKINNLGDFFYYTEFSRVIEIHTTYFALFVMISIVYFLFDIFKSKELRIWFSIIGIIFLLAILYIISSRISLIALFVSCLFFLMSNLIVGVSKYKKGIFLLLSIITYISFMLSPNFQNRNSGISKFGYQTPSLESRLIHWEAVINTIKSNNLMVGIGIKGGYENLYEEYLRIGFEQGYRYKYNAHNQFLESVLSFGILGLLSLSFIFMFSFYKAIKSKDSIAIIIIMVFFIFMLTESILVRHCGIISFVILMSLLLCRTTKYNLT